MGKQGLTCDVREGTREVLQLLLQELPKHVSLVQGSKIRQIDAAAYHPSAQMPPSLMLGHLPICHELKYSAYTWTMKPRAASMETRPWVTSASRHLLSSLQRRLKIVENPCIATPRQYGNTLSARASTVGGRLYR